MPARRTHGLVKPATLSLVVHELMFPHHLNFTDVQRLALVSKKMRRCLDARKEILEYVCNRLGAPKTPNYWRVHLTTLFKARAVHLSTRINNPVSLPNAKETLRNWGIDMHNRIGECCGVCFCYTGDGKTYTWNHIKTRRLPTNECAFPFFYNNVCEDCAKTVPSDAA